MRVSVASSSFYMCVVRTRLPTDVSFLDLFRNNELAVGLLGAFTFRLRLVYHSLILVGLFHLSLSFVGKLLVLGQSARKRPLARDPAIGAKRDHEVCNGLCDVDVVGLTD